MSNNADHQYLDIARTLLDSAVTTENRTDTSARKLFGEQMSFDLREGFPLLTTKKVSLNNILVELFWFLKGDTNIAYLKENGCGIWNEWATESGDLGPVYGAQWRKWESIKIPHSEQEYKILTEQLGYKDIGLFTNKENKIETPVVYKKIDQIAEVMNSLKNNPTDRRMIVTAYNPAVKPTTSLKPWENAEINLQALPPCHMMFQLNTTPLSEEERVEIWMERRADQYMSNKQWQETTKDVEDPHGVAMQQAFDDWVEQTEDADHASILNDDEVPAFFLDMQMYQRSADWFLGVPYNIASYSALLMMFAQQANMIARHYVHTFGDYHIYENHVDVVEEQLKQEVYSLPTLKIKKADSIDGYTLDHFELVDYQHGPVLRGKVAV